jgi:hypothetical protein
MADSGQPEDLAKVIQEQLVEDQKQESRNSRLDLLDVAADGTGIVDGACELLVGGGRAAVNTACEIGSAALEAAPAVGQAVVDGAVEVVGTVISGILDS